MLVIDASAVVDLLLSTNRAAGIARVLSSVGEAHAPELIDPEVLAVVRRWTFRGWLEVGTAGRAIEELGQLSLVRHRHGALRRRTWELRDRCSAYDAYYVALAEQLDADLVTTDARLARAAGGLIRIAAAS